MDSSFVKALYSRETGGQDQTPVCVLMKKLDQLYIEEWWFDHSLLSTLLDSLKSLALKHKTVRVYMFRVLEEWKTDEDSRSLVFLARRIARNIDSLQLDFLTDMTEEIMMFTN